jgi:hypothetical protein
MALNVGHHSSFSNKGISGKVDSRKFYRLVTSDETSIEFSTGVTQV